MNGREARESGLRLKVQEAIAIRHLTCRTEKRYRSRESAPTVLSGRSLAHRQHHGKATNCCFRAQSQESHAGVRNPKIIAARLQSVSTAFAARNTKPAGDAHGKKPRPAQARGHPRRRCRRLQPANEHRRNGHVDALKAHRRELIDPAIAGHHGRIVKTTGDGALVEFGSVVDAVHARSGSSAA